MTPSLRTDSILAPLEVRSARTNRQMRKRVLLLTGLAGLLWSALLFAAPPTVNAGVILQAPTYVGLNFGLVGSWSFDAKDMAGVTAYDRSGQGNNGTLTSGPLRTAGKLGQGLSFDGSNAHVTISSGAVVSAVPFSMSVWVKGEDGPDPDSVVLVGVTDSDAATWEAHYIQYSENTGTFSVTTADDSNFSSASSVGETLSTSTWHHIVGVWTSTTDRAIYVDGEFIARNTTSRAPSTMDSTKIGGLDAVNAGMDNFSKGVIDDVRIYNRALSADEIKRLYNMGGTLKINATRKDVLTSGLVGHWTFDGQDMAGVTAYDRSGRGNNGVVQSVTTRAVGKIGQGLEFHGVAGANDYVNAGSDPSLDDVAVKTVSAWIRPDSYGATFGRVMGKDNSSGSCWAFSVSPSAGTFNAQSFAFANVCFDSSPGLWSTPTASIITKRWYHIALVYDRTGSENDPVMYIDGVSQTVTENTSPSGSPTSDADFELWIGNRPDLARTFDGLIDEVRFYNRALSAAEIKRLYNMGGTLKINVTRKDTLRSGLVGHWTFDQPDIARNNSGIITAYDRSGNANIGVTASAGVTPARALGKIGQALTFDGSNDYVLIANDPITLDITTSFSIAGWAKASSIAGAAVFGRRDANNDGYALLADNNENCGATNKLILTIGHIDSFFTGWCGATDIQVGRWYHVAGVYNATAQTMKVYVDGVDDGGSICAGCGQGIGSSFPSAGVGSAIGADGGNTTFDFAGALDDIRVYNHALSAGEIKRLYNMGR
jgi:hypothetical protein